jgi:hypothetical protein
LCVLNEHEKLTGDTEEKRQTEETIGKQSPDEYPIFQKSGNDTFASDLYYYHNTPTEVLQEQLKRLYISIRWAEFTISIRRTIARLWYKLGRKTSKSRERKIEENKSDIVPRNENENKSFAVAK